MYQCPYENCDFTSKTLFGLKIHATYKHKLNGVCPVCREKYKNLNAHFANNIDCEKHRMLYVLHTPKNQCNRKKMKELEEGILW